MSELIKRRFSQVLHLLLNKVLQIPLWLLTWLVPRDKDLWVFGSWSGTRFVGNTKAFFVYCNKTQSTLGTYVWISQTADVIRLVRDSGFTAYTKYSLRGLWTSLHAGKYVFDSRSEDINYLTARGAEKINLWHGVPLKKIEKDIEVKNHPVKAALDGDPGQKLFYKIVRPEFSEKYSAIIASSDWVAARLSSAFSMHKDNIHVTGYPQNDVRGSNGAVNGFMIDRMGTGRKMHELRSTNKRILLYVPTFRDWQNFSSRRLPLDWSRLEKLLAENEAILYCKLHPVDRSSVPVLNDCECIRFLDVTEDVSELMWFADVLITDYSSVYFDFLLTNRPIIFYPYDLDEYQAKGRSFYGDYFAETPGDKVFDEAELCERLSILLRDFETQSRTWTEEREKMCNLVHVFQDCNASQRLFEFLR